MLAMYKENVVSNVISFGQLNDLLHMENENKLLIFLKDLGILAKEHFCEFCGGNMRKGKQRNTWYWVCSRCVNGVKCNGGKFRVRKGMFYITHICPFRM